MSVRNAHRMVSNKTKNGLSITTADQCYGCNKFFIGRKSLERHMNVCGHFPEIVYKFENKNIQTFFNNMKFMEDLPFSSYFDLETTPDKKVYNFHEDASFYPISYAFVVAFHPLLNIENTWVVRSFNHAFEQLNYVSYLKDEMLPFIYPITTRQLKDCAVAAFTKKTKIFSVGNVFLQAEICYGFGSKVTCRNFF